MRIVYGVWLIHGGALGLLVVILEDSGCRCGNSVRLHRCNPTYAHRWRPLITTTYAPHARSRFLLLRSRAGDQTKGLITLNWDKYTGNGGGWGAGLCARGGLSVRLLLAGSELWRVGTPETLGDGQFMQVPHYATQGQPQQGLVARVGAAAANTCRVLMHNRLPPHIPYTCAIRQRTPPPVQY